MEVLDGRYAGLRVATVFGARQGLGTNLTSPPADYSEIVSVY